MQSVVNPTSEFGYAEPLDISIWETSKIVNQVNTKKSFYLISFYGLHEKTIDITILFLHTISKEVYDMIIRPNYINTLKIYRDVPLVKILAGIRRCGKSTILDMLRNDLLESGITADHIITMRYTSEDFDDGMTDKDMYNGIKEHMTGEGRYYLLLDEVQEINGWEKAVNSLLENANTDIYVTGSNSKLMSSEISTYLTGRYISIPVYTLSFAEYLEFKKADSPSPKELLNEYLRLGGFPIVALSNFDERSAYQIVEGIYNSVITNDITKRHNIMNFDLFNRVVKYIVENVGKTFSANAIAKFLKSERRSLSVEAVYNYLDWLEKAFVIYRCQRYDLQGKAVLKTQEKFYLADASLKYCIMGFDLKSIPSMLENVVYFELKRRGYEVYIGKSGTKEIDFVAVQRDERIYVQVCTRLPEESDRELANLLEIKDHYPKYVVTLDELATGNINGVKIVHLADFLLSHEY